jgi:oxygen-independent coproporphyrinogen-3 oxidase
MTLRPSSEPIKTIYLGGGTPSQLTISQLRQLFLYINKVYGNDAEEITIEMNPDDVTIGYATILSQLGINRVSMGAQTFDNQRLRFLHRRHQAEQVQQAVNILRGAGIQNISIDLMYGFPNETLDDWKRDIDEALSLNVEHISAYCLMIEEGTVLYEQMRNEKLGMRNEETERQMYELLMDKLTEAGYEHYEISNFARPGYRSRHNSSYWHDVPYIGLGAAAHSYDLKSRSWNIADIKEYVASIHQGELPAESEDIDEVKKLLNISETNIDETGNLADGYFSSSGSLLPGTSGSAKYTPTALHLYKGDYLVVNAIGYLSNMAIIVSGTSGN